MAVLEYGSKNGARYSSSFCASSPPRLSRRVSLLRLTSLPPAQTTNSMRLTRLTSVSGTGAKRQRRQQTLPQPTPLSPSVLAAMQQRRASVAAAPSSASSSAAAIVGAEGMTLYRSSCTITEGTIDAQPISASFSAAFSVEQDGAEAAAIDDPPPTATIRTQQHQQHQHHCAFLLRDYNLVSECD